ncbi:DUF6221 family protein [Nocardia xishanensis]|uniref:DUF6221 family protein n=1 Tax=Nocardia xishanensis TaxID=238964 RepID=UPI00082B28F2|nr:DUF6221 family protein [Nocardia xishanensis]
MTRIEEFIEARLAEDEEWAHEVAAAEQSASESLVLFVRRWLPASFGKKHPDPWPLPGDPARVLREVASMRAIVGRKAGEHREQNGACETCRDFDYRRDYDPVPWPCPTSRSVASIWANHPDYQPEWAT